MGLHVHYANWVSPPIEWEESVVFTAKKATHADRAFIVFNGVTLLWINTSKINLVAPDELWFGPLNYFKMAARWTLVQHGLIPQNVEAFPIPIRKNPDEWVSIDPAAGGAKLFVWGTEKNVGTDDSVAYTVKLSL